MGCLMRVGGNFKVTQGPDMLSIGLALDVDRIASPNERYDIRSLHKGARSWARILDDLA